MSFQPIHPNQISLDLRNRPIVNTNTFRLVTGGSLLDRPTFGEKFMMGLKKFGSIFGRIGASILKFFPFPGSQIAAAGLYGISDVAERSYQNQVKKRLDNLALDEAASQASLSVLTPGFGMFGSPAPVGGTPPSNTLETEKWETVLHREAAARENIKNL